MTLSVPANKETAAVPAPRTKARPAVTPGCAEVRLQIPDRVLLLAQRRAEGEGKTMEDVLGRLLAVAVEAALGGCKDRRGRGRGPHVRGTINVRHCALCGAFMPPDA